MVAELIVQHVKATCLCGLCVQGGTNHTTTVQTCDPACKDLLMNSDHKQKNQVRLTQFTGLQADLEFSRLESLSRDPFLQVLVLVLDSSSLGLGLDLGTWESDAFKELHQLLKSLLSACHLCSYGADIQPQCQWFADAGKYCQNG